MHPEVLGSVGWAAYLILLAKCAAHVAQWDDNDAVALSIKASAIMKSANGNTKDHNVMAVI